MKISNRSIPGRNDSAARPCFSGPGRESPVGGRFCTCRCRTIDRRGVFFRGKGILCLAPKSNFHRSCSSVWHWQNNIRPEGRPLDFQRRPSQLPGIVRMQEQYPLVTADDFNPLIKGGAPGAALEAVVAVAVTAPAAFQHDALVKTHLPGSDQDSVFHVKFFCQLQIFFHLFIIHPGRRQFQPAAFCFSPKVQGNWKLGTEIGDGDCNIVFRMHGIEERGI